MAESPLGPPFMLETPVKPEAEGKKLKAKKKSIFTPPSNSMVTRSQGKRPSDDQEEVVGNEKPPMKKKPRIFVEGTLGHGENAVEIHPDSQAVLTQGSSHAVGEDTETRPSQVEKPAVDTNAHTKPALSTGMAEEPKQAPVARTDELLTTFSPAELMLLRQMLDRQAKASEKGLAIEVGDKAATAPSVTETSPIQKPTITGEVMSNDTKKTNKVETQDPPTTPSSKVPSVTEASPIHKAAPSNPTSEIMSKNSETPPRSSHPGPKKSSFTPLKSSPSAGFSPSQSPSSDKSNSDNTTIYPARGKIPPVCQVVDKDSQDPMLADKYVGLTPLEACQVGSLSKEAPGDFYSCSQWVEDIPTMDINMVLSALNFALLGTNVNPARANPEDIGYRESKNKSKIRRELYIGEAPALCWTTVFVRKSDITELTKAGQKSIVGVPHCQEVDRLTAALAMSLGIAGFRTNFYQSGLSFNTYGYAAVGTQFNGRRSRLISGNVVESAFTTLGNHDTIFVFDCRNWEHLTLTDILGALEGLRTRASIIQKMGQLGFDQFEGEIPVGSCAVIAHTVNISSDGKDGFVMNFNIQFALLLGVPPPKTG